MSDAPDYWERRSWATEPGFFRAPFPGPAEPHPYQQAGVEFALAHTHCLIGDQPGLGKSAQGILISNALKARRTLIICPASLRINWEREIKMWSTQRRPALKAAWKDRDPHIHQAKRDVSDEAAFVIVSYDGFRNKGLCQAVMALKWDHVIMDEVQAIKDPKGNQRTKFICPPDRLPLVTGRFTGLSGTPAPNQPIELYNVVRLFDWEAIDYMDLGDFREYYYEEGGGMVRSSVLDAKSQTYKSELHWSDTVRNIPRRHDELQRRLRSRLMVRRLKSQVLTQLPPKQFHLMPLAITAEMRAALAHPGWGEVAQMYDLDPDQFAKSIPVDGEVSTARRLLGEAKVGPACDYVEELLDEGVEKIVVSAWHTSVLTEARRRLEKHGLVYMDGSTPNTKGPNGRQAQVDRFQTDPAIRVILGQTQVIGTGFTLTAAQDVVLLEPDWVPGNVEQMVDRVHRIGQKGAYVQAHLPVVPDTLDERIVATAIGKSRDLHKVLDARRD